MMESVEAWLNDWITLYYANRKPFWVPDYACLINKEQLTAICSGKIIADEEDLFRRIPNWDPSILGPELQSFLTKLRDAHRESVAPKKRKAVGPAPQKSRRKRHCGSKSSYEIILDLGVTNAEAIQPRTDGVSRSVHPGGSQAPFELVFDPLILLCFFGLCSIQLVLKNPQLSDIVVSRRTSVAR